MQKSVNFLELLGGDRIPEVLLGTWIVMGILIVFGFIARASIAGAADPVVPDDGISIRSISEMIVEWLDGFVSEVTEMHGSRAMVPFFGCIFMFILFANFFGLIPGMEPPTADSDLTFALASQRSSRRPSGCSAPRQGLPDRRRIRTASGRYGPRKLFRFQTPFEANRW